MFSPSPIRHTLPAGDESLDALLDTLPREPAVFLLDVGENQKPYLSRTANLRLRLKRLLRHDAEGSRMLNLRPIARELCYWLVDSTLASSLLLLEQAKPLYPERYRRMLGLRPLYFVSLLTGNPFPRAVVTRRPADEESAFGPFLNRGQAEAFLDQALALFQLRRCDEDLDPREDHPGCIYGEMAMCLRPCQDLSAGAAYRQESRRFLAFLATGGASLKEQIEHERDAASEALDFEAAAKHHKRLAKLAACFGAGSGIATQYARFHGVAVTPASGGQARLWPVWEGHVQPPIRLEAVDAPASALADLLRQSRGAVVRHDDETKQELLTVLVRWLHSSWCDGEWIRVEDTGKLPGRKLRNAVLRLTGVPVAAATQGTEGNEASRGPQDL